MGEPADWSSWWAAWKRLNRQDPAEYSHALVAMSWSASTSSNYAVHIRALGTLAAAQLEVDKSKLLDRYLRALFGRADHGHTCEGLSTRYELWQTWDGSTEWLRLDIGAWRSPPSETRRSKDRTEGWKRYPCLYSPVARRSNGPDWPSPSSLHMFVACGGGCRGSTARNRGRGRLV